MLKILIIFWECGGLNFYFKGVRVLVYNDMYGKCKFRIGFGVGEDKIWNKCFW